MRIFNYSAIREQKWDSEILGLVAAIYKEAGKQELYLKQRPEELEKLVEIAKVQSTEASNAIEGIVTTNTRIRHRVRLPWPPDPQPAARRECRHAADGAALRHGEPPVRAGLDDRRDELPRVVCSLQTPHDSEYLYRDF